MAEQITSDSIHKISTLQTLTSPFMSAYSEGAGGGGGSQNSVFLIDHICK